MGKGRRRVRQVLGTIKPLNPGLLPHFTLHASIVNCAHIGEADTIMYKRFVVVAFVHVWSTMEVVVLLWWQASQPHL